MSGETSFIHNSHLTNDEPPAETLNLFDITRTDKDIIEFNLEAETDKLERIHNFS